MAYPPEQEVKQGSITRRSFAAGAAIAAATVFIKPEAALAQNDKPAPASAQSQDAAMAKLSPGAQAEVEMKVNSIFRKYGNRLNDEQKADIRHVMAETQSGLEKMRSFPLENGDLPATIFRVYRGSEKK
jgi:hypothetical protein